MITLCFKFCAQLAEIVDASIENQCETEVGVDHWLLRFFGKIEDPQSSVTEANIAPDDDTRCVRPAGA